MDDGHETKKGRAARNLAASRREPLPLVSNDERAFWRRAVETERARQRCGRPAPFPFQPG
jgi:hypothetical protein